MAFGASCAHSRWTRDGATQMEFANDKQFCALYARRLNENYTWTRALTESDLFNQCMWERGWQRVRSE